MNRRDFILASVTSVVGTTTLVRPALAKPDHLEVFKSPTCGCCSAWIDHMANAGFETVARDVEQETLWAVKTRAGITPDLSSCHTAFIDGYFVEGHVPADDVLRLLAERSDALGLTVPSMPIGSPGMEMGNQRDAYETLLVLRDGSTEVLERHI